VNARLQPAKTCRSFCCGGIRPLLPQFPGHRFYLGKLALLAHIQFPWRVNAELLLCGAMIGACLTGALSNRPRNGTGRIIAWVASIGVAGVLVANIGNSCITLRSNGERWKTSCGITSATGNISLPIELRLRRFSGMARKRLL
jgi:hypothetical protein